MMGELIGLVASKQALLVLGAAVLIFGFCPGFLLRQIVRMYPKGHPRRAEIIAELYAITYVMRPIWVAAQLETALHEGLSLRHSARKARRHARRLSRNNELASTMTRADLIAAALVLDMGDPEKVRVLVDHRGIHYWTPELPVPYTMHPHVIRFLALKTDKVEKMLVTLELSEHLERWQQEKDKQPWSYGSPTKAFRAVVQTRIAGARARREM